MRFDPPPEKKTIYIYAFLVPMMINHMNKKIDYRPSVRTGAMGAIAPVNFLQRVLSTRPEIFNFLVYFFEIFKFHEAS